MTRPGEESRSWSQSVSTSHFDDKSVMLPSKRAFERYSKTSGRAGASSSQGGTGKPLPRRNDGLNIFD